MGKNNNGENYVNSLFSRQYSKIIIFFFYDFFMYFRILGREENKFQDFQSKFFRDSFLVLQG